jgi:hypothetical protein
MQLSEEYQREIDERCARNRTIAAHQKNVATLNEKIDRLVGQMVRSKIVIAKTKEDIFKDVSDKAQKEMRMEFIRKASKDKEIELFT